MLEQFHLMAVLQVVIVICGLGGNVLINRKNVKGFYWWIVANALLIIMQVLMATYVLMILYVAYFILAIQGIISWKKLANPNKTPQQLALSLEYHQAEILRIQKLLDTSEK